MPAALLAVGVAAVLVAPSASLAAPRIGSSFHVARARAALPARASPKALLFDAGASAAAVHHATSAFVAPGALDAHVGAVSVLIADAMDAVADGAAAVDAVAAAAPVTDDFGGGPIGLGARGVAWCITALHGALEGAGVPGPYGSAIIIFTLIMKGLLFPLNYAQIKSTTQMQAIQPKIAAIRAKYGDNPSDPNALNQEIAALYQEEQLNPLAGCLPSLAQIPVFISLYRALIALAKADALEEPFLWLPSLEGPVKEQGMGLDWLTSLQYGVDGTLAYLVLPVLLVVAQFVSFQVLTPPSDDPNTKRTQDILKFLPLLIGFFSLSTPSGLSLYWLLNSVITTSLTLLIRQQIGYTPPQPASATAAQTGAAPASSSSAPPKGFGAFKSGSTVDLDAWPSTRSPPSPPPPPRKPSATVTTTAPADAVTVKIITPQDKAAEAEAQPQAASQAVEADDDGAPEHASAEAHSDASDDGEESRAAAKRKAKASAKRRSSKGKKTK